MIARSFKSVAWVAAIGVAALICYIFSLRVAEERAGLAQLEAQIRRTQQSIQTLKTELGTRGRIHQLQHWASADFGFTAPKAGQFLDSEVTLARFDTQAVPALEAPVRMAQAAPAAPALPRPVQASAPAPARTPAQTGAAVRQASAEAERERPLLRQAAMVQTTRPAVPTRAAVSTRAAATTVPAARPARPAAARPKPRASALVDARTLSDLAARSRAERGEAGGRAAN